MVVLKEAAVFKARGTPVGAHDLVGITHDPLAIHVMYMASCVAKNALHILQGHLAQRNPPPPLGPL